MRNDILPLFPCQEFPLRCFISSRLHDRRISCTPNGDILTSDERQDGEEWLIIGCADDTFRLQSRVHGKFLLSDVNGQICTSDCIPNDQGQWKLIKKSPDIFSFLIYTTCGKNQRQLSCEGDGVNTILMQEQDQWYQYSNPSYFWDIELLSGELCFLSSPGQDRRLSCHPWSGRLSMSSNWKGWEVWRFIEAGNDHVRISNWTHQKKFLCSDSDGTVWTSNNHLGSWEMWKVERAPNGYNGVVLKSVSHGRFLKAAVNGSPVSTSPTFDGFSTTWHTDAGHRQSFYISSVCQGKRIGSSESQVYITSNRKAKEVWEIKQQSDGSVSLHSKAHGKNLGSGPDGSLYVTEELGEGEKWELTKITKEGILCVGLKSIQHDRYLCCDTDGQVSTILSDEDMSSSIVAWSLDPYLPETMSGGKMRNLAIGGSVAALSIVAAPFAVMGAVSALGFGAGGIASGSIAAGWMSAEAIASGGMIAAGGTVATLQSIGAAGLGIAGTSAALGAGATFGATALGISAAVPSNGPSSKDVAVDNSGGMKVSDKRPFCNWRNWEY
mmetsp:Transcript_14012/g.21279  ORF Transcript_14012/g.21279 Transcript_14012/m.21279 type:complete len:552 (+) Transcript_14012:79-1734(+)